MNLIFSVIAKSVFVCAFLTAQAQAQFERLPRVAPAPADNPTTSARVELGKKLFFDARLSADGTVSCQTCHSVFLGGTDQRKTSSGIRAQIGGRNAPTVLNAAFLSAQFWDGRAASLEEQAKGPLTNPIEMGMKDHDAVLARIRAIPGYAPEFTKAFATQTITIDQVAQAIAAFERTLLTPNSPVDQYLAGKKKALNAQQIEGMKLVQSVGCTSCHNGVNYAGPALPIGTGFYQKFPMFPGSEYESKYSLTIDQGRFDVTKKEEDRHFFRVPTWRNVALTAPYFHNGEVRTLDEAVRVMAKTQLHRDLKPNETQAIVAFLEGLTGEQPKFTAPILPPTPGTTLVGFGD